MRLRVFFETPLVVVHTNADLREPAATIAFQVGNLIFKGENMAGTMQVGTRATVSVEWKDTGGHTVKVDGPTKWESSDDTMVQCTASTGNPQIANLFAPGPVGNCQIHATADADLGEGVKSVTATIDITVISGEAVGGDITFTPASGPVQGQPPQATPRGGLRR